MTTESKQKYEALYKRIEECKKKIGKLNDLQQARILYGVIGAMQGTCIVNYIHEYAKYDGCEAFAKWLENAYEGIANEL